MKGKIIIFFLMFIVIITSNCTDANYEYPDLINKGVSALHVEHPIRFHKVDGKELVDYYEDYIELSPGLHTIEVKYFRIHPSISGPQMTSESRSPLTFTLRAKVGHRYLIYLQPTETPLFTWSANIRSLKVDEVKVGITPSGKKEYYIKEIEAKKPQAPIPYLK